MSHPQSLLNQAIAHHKAGRFQDAENVYRALLDKNAGHPDILRLLGTLYLQTGAKDRAVDFLEKAQQKAPNNPEILTNLGIALCGLQRQGEALPRFRQAVKAKAAYAPALSHLGKLCQDMNLWDEAKTAYEKLAEHAPTQASVHNDLGQCLLALGKTSEAIPSFEKALALNPNDLPARVNLGIAYGILGKNDLSAPWLGKAEDHLRQAVARAPDHPSVLNNLGNILRQQGKTEEAVLLYRKALSLRPDYGEAMINLALGLRDQGHLNEALDTGQKAVAFRPASLDAKINLGTLRQMNNQHEEAVSLFDEVLKADPSSIDAKWNKSLSLLALGHYREGWALHETGLGLNHMRGPYNPERRWNNEDLAGKRLLIRSEQGFGDSLQFIRYAKLCKTCGATVLVSCPAPLRRLFSNAAFIDSLPESEGSFDFQIPMMSLPYAFETETDCIPNDVPYLRASEAARAIWTNRLPKTEAFTVGLVWAGNARENIVSAHLTDRRRSIDLETLRPLFGLPNVRFVSLQKGPKAEQIVRAGLQDKILDPMNEVEDFDDTAALIETLDLVISVDTSVAHLAGALGKPVWILSRYDACWRWLRNRSKNPWYPTARIFGQPSPGNWESVVEEVAKTLAKTIRSTTA